jgi:hypothetical protein
MATVDRVPRELVLDNQELNALTCYHFNDTVWCF